MIPAVILVALAIPAAETLIRMNDTRNAQLTIKVTGYQWRWQYDYLDDGVKFFSVLDRKSNAARQLRSGIDPKTVENYLLEVDNPLVVPVNTKVRLLVTAADVIHSWWVPAFGVKQDAIPGYINEVWFTADDRRHVSRPVRGALRHGPRLHADRRARARAATEYDTWLASQKAAAQTSQNTVMSDANGATERARKQGRPAMSSTAFDTHGHGHHGEHARHGAVAWILRWITTTNHKDIGTLYCCFSLLMLFVGGAHGDGDSRRAVPARACSS